MQGRYGIPSPGKDKPTVMPDIVLVPLLAYDGVGRRLGYGAGHYDRTLQHLRDNGPVWAVGVAYAEQMFDDLPEDQYDQRLDAVLTENGLENFSK